jgi:hypothetical protein
MTKKTQFRTPVPPSDRRQATRPQRLLDVKEGGS